MIQVMVVDDEYYAREGMKKTIDWEQYGCALCGEAEDALQGIELAKKTQPDIVITDICMPGMDGITMAQKIREYVAYTQFIIVTGYDEFEYAKRAFKIDAIDFLLKPIDQQEFIKVIQKASLICKRQKEERKKQQKKLNTPMGQLYDEVFVSKMQEKILISIQARDRLRMEKQLETLYINNLKSKNLDLGIVKGISMNIILATINIVKQSNVVIQKMTYQKSHIYIEMDRMETIDEVYEFVHTVLVKATCSLKQADIKAQETGIEDAVTYIRNNYTKDISLSDVAKQSFLSESYLSRRIKKVLGIGFSEYVTQLRMEEAMWRLQSANAKVTDVATQVGYTDYRYFSQTFKKYTGYSPREYGKVKI